jgi:hypothetical protein
MWYGVVAKRAADTAIILLKTFFVPLSIIYVDELYTLMKIN